MSQPRFSLVYPKLKSTPKAHENMPQGAVTGALVTTSGVSAAVWITLIIVVGITVIVALSRDYNATVKVGDNELVFDRK